jgi:RimJ/RimL family protein N-acetyltransferase
MISEAIRTQVHDQLPPALRVRGVEHDIVLVGEGLRLRPFRRGDSGDVAVVRRIAADPAAWQWSSSLRQVDSDGAAEAWINGRLDAPDRYEWIVEAADTHEVLGRIGCHQHSDEGDVEVGYWTLPSARGRGVARAATRLVARFGHEQLGRARIALVHVVANGASCRVALAASFRLEGTRRASMDHGDGVLWDAHVHARLRDDSWDPLPAPLAPALPIEVPGDGIVLRPWVQSDAPAILSVRVDPDLARWNPLKAKNPEDVRRWIEDRGSWTDFVSWAVQDTTSGLLVGSVSWHDLDATQSSAEAGYWVVPAARGRGIGGRALRAATGFAFEVLGVERLQLFHAVDNPASCGVARSAGFALEGTTRSSYRYGDGDLHDEHLHARLASDGTAGP